MLIHFGWSSNQIKTKKETNSIRENSRRFLSKKIKGEFLYLLQTCLKNSPTDKPTLLTNYSIFFLSSSLKPDAFFLRGSLYKIVLQFGEKKGAIRYVPQQLLSLS